MNACISESDDLMASNRLNLIQIKTYILWCATNRRQRFDVRDRGVLISNDLSMTANVNLFVSRCFYQLRRIKNWCRALPCESVKTLVNCCDFISKFVQLSPRMSSLASTTDKLQCVLNAAAKLTYGGQKFDHVTPLMRNKIYWPTVPERVIYKLCLLNITLPMAWLRGIWRISVSHSPISQQSDRWGFLQSDIYSFRGRTQSSVSDRGSSVTGWRACNSQPHTVRQAD